MTVFEALTIIGLLSFGNGLIGVAVLVKIGAQGVAIRSLRDRVEQLETIIGLRREYRPTGKETMA